ncbi:MAG: succinylglutamate desuccinylase/aspartoacylase family protein, partial [Candidatus Peregrinibacteria bacterium]
MQAIKVKIPGKIIKIPYLTFRGQTEGKTCVISGGVHGDEVNGIQLVREFIEYARKHKIEKTLKGKIIILPIVNQKGFEKNSRFNPEDDKDINRNYNKKEKTASNLIANALERHFYSKADLA